MDLLQVIQDRDYSVRTQISLSPSLYQLIKQEAKREEKSMAQIIREKIINQLKKEEEKEKRSRERLIQLTQEIRKIAESGRSGWAKVKNPHALIRKWRREEEEHWMKKVGLRP